MNVTSKAIYSNDDYWYLDIGEAFLFYLMKTIGLVGNILLFLVYMFGRKLRQLSVSVYFQSITSICCLQICFYLLTGLNVFSIFNRSAVSLKMLNYFSSLFLPITVWLELVVTLDRFLNILFPIRFPFLKKHSFQRLVVVIVIIYNMIFYLSILIVIEMRLKLNIKESKLLMKIKQTLDLYNSTIVPLALILTFTIATFVAVIRSQRHIESLGHEHHRLKKRRRRDLKFGMTMIAVNLFFLIFTVINRLSFLFVLNPFDPAKQYVVFMIFSMIVFELSESYYIFNFYVQLAVNSLVRRESRHFLRRLFCLRSRIQSPARSVSFSRGRSFE